MAELQESNYGEGRDYVAGSPHLQHAHLRERIEGDLGDLVRRLIEAEGSCRVLEVGAGHGTFTAALVDAGAHVTVTEMSQPSVKVLAERFADQPGVSVVHDPDGTEGARLVAQGCDLVVFVSVLHHIPDYVAAVSTLTSAMNEGSAFYCVQDPLWYPDRSRWSMMRDKGSYLLWRAAQGNVSRGLKTRLRRIRRVYDESEPSDMVEYHVVRQGVDESALTRVLGEQFADVDLWCYWSTQSVILQRLGDRLGWTSTFGITARGRFPRP